MAPGKSLDMSRRTALYRLYDAADQLLYIGISFNPAKRGYQHAMASPWWHDVARKEITWYETRPDAEAAERDAVLAERPLYNVRRIRAPRGPRARWSPTYASIAEALERATKEVKLAEAAREQARAKLRDLIADAAAAGMPPAQITNAISRYYARSYISLIARGKA